VRWHREGFRLYWRWKSRHAGVRREGTVKLVPVGLRRLIGSGTQRHEPVRTFRLRRPSISARDHQPCRMALLPVPAEPAHRRTRCWPPAASSLATRRCGSGALKFGQAFANAICRRLPRVGDKWHIDEVVIKIAGTTHWLARAFDQHAVVLDVLVQSRRDAKPQAAAVQAAEAAGPRARVMITDKPRQLSAAKEGSHAWRRASPA